VTVGPKSSVPLELEGGATQRDLIVRSDPSVRGVRVRRDAAAQLTSVHLDHFHVAVKETMLKEEITRDVPNVGDDALTQLDAHGVIREGEEVRPGTILIGRIQEKAGTQLSPEEKLLRAIFGDKAGDVRDTSVRCPPGVKGRVTEAHLEKTKSSSLASVTVRDERPLRVGDVLEIDGTRSVVSAIVDSQEGELRWSGPSGTFAIRKVDTAETLLEARSIGPYSLVSQQPLGGKVSFGGQRVDEAQVRALEHAGAWFAAAELLGVKSDDVIGRTRLYEGIIRGQEGLDFGRPESASVLLRELEAMGFAIAEVREEEEEQEVEEEAP